MAQQAGSEPGSGGAGYLGQVDRALEDLAADTGDEALHRRMFGGRCPGRLAAPMVFPGVQWYDPGADPHGVSHLLRSHRAEVPLLISRPHAWSASEGLPQPIDDARAF
jgi:hypothetical protein